LRLSGFLEDRSRLARDLHDTVLQSLYAIGLSIETARRARPDSPPDARYSGDLVVDQLNKLIHQVRGMVQGLESGTVEEFDLATELQTLVTTYVQISPIQINLDVFPDVSLYLTREEKQEIVNIAREAVSNCVRHARATHATISLALHRSRIRLLVSDNGIGFTPTENRIDGYGLANMAARARKLGGRLRIRSRAGSGTRVDMEFALEPALAPL
jgi:signal transduction histidine kinase